MDASHKKVQPTWTEQSKNLINPRVNLCLSCLLSEKRTTSSKPKGRSGQRQLNEQYDSHINPCTACVRISYQQTQYTLIHPSIIIMSTVKFINEVIYIYFSARTFSIESKALLLFYWSWNFWEIFSLISVLKNFSRMKHWWRKELQLLVTTCINIQMKLC